MSIEPYYSGGSWQSGQLHLAVNQAVYTYRGSNPLLPI